MQTTNGSKVVACARVLLLGKDSDWIESDEQEIAHEMTEIDALAARYKIKRSSAALLRLGALGTHYGKMIGVITYLQLTDSNQDNKPDAT